MNPYQPRQLTWVALLGRWVDFARSALALPDDAVGRAWKTAVPEIIGLQALTMALKEADQLPADEQALALDRARLLMEGHKARLHSLFGPSLHPMLEELLQDAHHAIIRLQTPGG